MEKSKSVREKEKYSHLAGTFCIVRELPVPQDHKDLEQYNLGVSDKKIYYVTLLTTTVCFVQATSFFHFTQNIM